MIALNANEKTQLHQKRRRHENILGHLCRVSTIAQQLWPHAVSSYTTLVILHPAIALHANTIIRSFPFLKAHRSPTTSFHPILFCLFLIICSARSSFQPSHLACSLFLHPSASTWTRCSFYGKFNAGFDATRYPVVSRHTVHSPRTAHQRYSVVGSFV